MGTVKRIGSTRLQHEVAKCFIASLGLVGMCSGAGSPHQHGAVHWMEEKQGQ
jgi:hypothetical protein